MPELTETAPRRDSTPWGSILRNVLLVLVLLTMVWLALNVRLPSLDELQARIAELGAVGPVRLHRAVRGRGCDPDPGDDHGGGRRA